MVTVHRLPKNVLGGFVKIAQKYYRLLWSWLGSQDRLSSYAPDRAGCCLTWSVLCGCDEMLPPLLVLKLR